MCRYTIDNSGICEYPDCKDISVAIAEYTQKGKPKKMFLCYIHFVAFMLKMMPERKDSVTEMLEKLYEINELCWNCQNRYLNGANNDYRCRQNQNVKKEFDNCKYRK